MPVIKIADDDVELAENLQVLLRKEGFTVTVQNRIEGLVDALVKNRPDLLVLDVMFPGTSVSGFDAAREIRRTRGIEDLPIILLTGVNQEFPLDFSAEDIDSDWLPVQAFMEKPVKAANLVKKINELLSRKSGKG